MLGGVYFGQIYPAQSYPGSVAPDIHMILDLTMRGIRDQALTMRGTRLVDLDIAGTRELDATFRRLPNEES